MSKLETNEQFVQSVTKVHITTLASDSHIATIKCANINGITCDIKAEFATFDTAMLWVHSFGILSYTTRTLMD